MEYVEELKVLMFTYLPPFILALFVLIVGWWIIGRISKLIFSKLGRIDLSLRAFLTSMLEIILKVLLVISVAGMVGIQTTSFIALIGAAGLAVGLALQGTLANFAGGVLIIIFKPYRVGDLIEAQGKTGQVKTIQIFNTILATGKGETVILPNGAVSNGIIVNYTTEGSSLVEVQVELDSETDLKRVRSIAIPLIGEDKRVYDSPPPSVDLLALKPGAMVLAFRARTSPASGSEVYGAMIEKIKTMISNYNLPTPVRRVNVHNSFEDDFQRDL
ncbi:mechanosensitive ion channel [Flavihumibacter sp. R14]|nr:mechanosensitive ion channel [Flavihumibacter soli]